MTFTTERISATSIRLTRHIPAPPQAVWAGHTEPTIIPKWMCGDGGTTMPVCESDPRPGGRIHYQWREPDGSGFTLRGSFETVEAPHRIVHTEAMYLPDPTPANRIETRFTANGAGTDLEMVMTLPTAANAEALLAMGMIGGMEGCYAMLDAMLVSQAA